MRLPGARIFAAAARAVPAAAGATVLIALVTALTGAAAVPADVTPPSSPAQVQLCPPPLPAGTTVGYVGLCWSAATDDVGVTGYEVYRLDAGGFVRATTTTGTTAVMGGLTYGQAYTFYIVAKDAAGNTSEPTAPVTATAVTGVVVTPSPRPGDITPPSRPAGLREGCIADFPGTEFCWTAATDDVGVTAYDVYRRTATGWIRAGSTSMTYFTEGGLVTGKTYTYFVVARDAAGNISRPSDPLSVLASPGLPVPGCEVAYDARSWSGGFGADLTITNTGSAVLNGWMLRFTFPAGQRVVHGWSATWSQAEAVVTAAKPSWDTPLRPGESRRIGFIGTYIDENPEPAAFTLNGVPCAVR
ncbi:cellulose binding domain-containing protein [Sphaerisporangium rufum]|nr:cellulose binding domain-containing protein [Sphaerisporangium rufum]